MSALGPDFRFVVYNGTGQTIASNGIIVRYRGWKYSNDASVAFDGSITTGLQLGTTPASPTTLTNATYLVSAAIDNSVTKLIGATIEFTVTAPASASGDVILYIERSLDDGTTFPDNGLGQVIAVLNFTTSGTKRRIVHL
jgi:hypothetical protein